MEVVQIQEAAINLPEHFEFIVSHGGKRAAGDNGVDNYSSSFFGDPEAPGRGSGDTGEYVGHKDIVCVMEMSAVCLEEVGVSLAGEIGDASGVFHNEGFWGIVGKPRLG